MRDAIYERSKEAGVREDNFFFALSGGIAIEGCLDISQQNALDFGQLIEEVFANFINTFVDFFFASEWLIFARRAAEQECFGKLLAKSIFDTDERLANEVFRIGARRGFITEIAREHYASNIFDNADDSFLVGEVFIGISEEDFRRTVIFRNSFDNVVQIFVKHSDLSHEVLCCSLS